MNVIQRKSLLLATTCLSLSVLANKVYAENLWDALNTPNTLKYYTLDDKYTLSGHDSLGELQAGSFILEGNNHEIIINVKPGLIVGQGKNMTIQNAEIQSGKRRSDSPGGGAIRNLGTMTITGSSFANNNANGTTSTNGGAIYNNGTITKLYADFTENKSEKGYGGAIYNDSDGVIGNINDLSAAAITGTFKDNYADNSGGAIYNYGTITKIKDAEFYGSKSSLLSLLKKSSEYGGAIYNYLKIYSLENVSFNETKVSGSGGAIYNKGVIGNPENPNETALSGSFTKNEAHETDLITSNYGGAIYNDGTIYPIRNATFDSNKAQTAGGAIYNNSEIKAIASSRFIQNSAGTNYGGAIYNNGTIISIASSTFTQNSAYQGGAIYNNDTITALSADFIHNEVSYNDVLYYPMGGAIYNAGTIETVKGNFTNNYVKGNVSLGLYNPAGGAIYNDGTINRVEGKFTGNSVNGYGGAIYNSNSHTIKITADFINNYSIGDYQGGAIYNNYDLYIIADDRDITFSGNKQNVTKVTRDDAGNITEVEGGTSNAIFNNDYVELDAREGRTIWMYDRLAGNAGQNWEWVKTGAGTLALGENNGGVLDDVWIKEGTIKIVQNDKDPSIYGTGFYEAEVTWENNTRIDSQNDHIDDVILGRYVTLNGTVHALIDVNLANQTADKLLAPGSASGSGNIILDTIKIVTGGSTFESPKSVLIADENTKGKISLADNVSISGEGKTSWELTYTPSSGILKFGGDVTLKDVANASSPAERVFNAVKDELVKENIDGIGHDDANLIVNMNNYEIKGQNHGGLVTQNANQKLTVNDTIAAGFSKGSDGAFIYDNSGATIKINNSDVKNNSSTGNGGAIYSTGNVIVNASDKAVEFTDNTSGSGANDIYMSGNATTPATLALNAKDNTKTITFNSGIDGNNYNIIINNTSGNEGKVIFNADVNSDGLVVSKGTLENNANLTAKSGINNATISGTNGTFALDDGGAATPLEFYNKGSLAQKSLMVESGKFVANSGNIAIADGIINKGALEIKGGNVVAKSIENSGSDSTVISGGNITANTSITNSGIGSVDINSEVNTPLISAAKGTVNVNATNGQTATSNLLKNVAGTGAADISTASGGTLAVNTNAGTMTVDNKVSGDGTLTLNGNSGAAKSSSDVGTEFSISSNVTVSSAINLAAGQLNVGDASNITGAIAVAEKATLNTMNGGYSTFNNSTFADGSQLKVDVNAISNQTDNFANPDEGYEYLTDLSIQDMNKIAQDSKSINLSKIIGLNNLQKTDDLVSNLTAKYSNVMTPIRKMNANVQQTPDGLMLNFVGTGEEYEDYNPAVMVAPVAAQMGGYLTQLQSYDEAFRNMDMYMLATPSQNYDGASLERKRGWFRPHATNEKVKLKNGPKVENKAYGSYVGGESEMYNFGHGWSGIFGAYVGYEHSRQEYDEVSIRQNGGKIGVLGMAYKGKFYTGLTLNAGISEAKAHTVYGKEDFTLLMSGIASKTGYNAEFANGKFVIQPNWLMSYSYINTSNYTNAADVRIHSTPLQAIQLQPELKFIGNLEAGCQPYASVAMVWTSMDDTKFRANDVTLPELSVKPYAKYGVGIRKAWDEGYAGYVQTYITDGGRKGVGFQAGFTWEFGGGKNK